MSSSPDKPNVLCVGRLYCDIIFTDLPRMPTRGTEVFAGGAGLHAGGGAAITAGHFSALGHRTHLAAMRPVAGFGDAVLNELRALGIDLKLCRPGDPESGPQLTVAMVHNGDRAFVTNKTGPAFVKFSPEEAGMMDIAHIHIGEATTLLENPDLLQLAQAIGATVSLDCSWDDELDVKRLRQFLSEVDVFLPNETEMKFLGDRGVSEHEARTTVRKEGRKGATAFGMQGKVHIPAEDVVVVDTTGAGDAFNAAFVSAWLQKRPIEACLRAGNAQGALAVSHRGGLGGLAAAPTLQHVAE